MGGSGDDMGGGAALELVEADRVVKKLLRYHHHSASQQLEAMAWRSSMGGCGRDGWSSRGRACTMSKSDG
jgi:hypothetical protein